MYCSKCGSKVDENSLYCQNCGEPVNQKEAEIGNVNRDEKRPGGGKGKAVIGIIAAVLVIVLIIVGVSVGKNSGEETAATPENNEIQELDVTTIYLPEFSEAITIQEAMGSALGNINWTNYEENGCTYVKGEGEILCIDEVSRTVTVTLVNEENGFVVESIYVEDEEIDTVGSMLGMIYASAAAGDNSVLAAWLSKEEVVEEEVIQEPQNSASNDVMTDAAQVMMNLLYDAVFNWDNNSASLYSLWNQDMKAYEFALGDINGDGHGDAVIKLGGYNDVLFVYSVNGLYYGETVSAESVSGLDWHGMEYIQSRGWSLDDDYLMGFEVESTFF